MSIAEFKEAMIIQSFAKDEGLTSANTGIWGKFSGKEVFTSHTFALLRTKVARCRKCLPQPESTDSYISRECPLSPLTYRRPANSSTPGPPTRTNDIVKYVHSNPCLTLRTSWEGGNRETAMFTFRNKSTVEWKNVEKFDNVKRLLFFRHFNWMTSQARKRVSKILAEYVDVNEYVYKMTLVWSYTCKIFSKTFLLLQQSTNSRKVNVTKSWKEID